MIKKRLLCFGISVFLFSPNASGKEVFTVEHIKRHWTTNNAYVYGAVGQRYIDSARIQTAQGNFDTRLNVDYDNKDYPASTGEFSDISLSKPTENGTEFIMGYRQAEGTQEYNNIKTGDEGEFRAGIKIPVFAVLNDMNERKYNLESTKLNADKSTFDSQNNLRNLYAHIVISYYQLLYYYELVQLEEQLLHKAQKRNDFIQQRVESGDLPEVAILESEQQMISREQRVLTTLNDYTQALQLFLKYMNIPKNEFESKYDLPSLKMLLEDTVVLNDVINKALKNRPDLIALERQEAKLDLESEYNALSKYPKLNVFAYGVHDIQYGEGVKVGFQFEIPLERRGYEGKRIELQKSKTQLEEEKNRVVLDLKTNLNNLMYSLDIVNKNIDLGNKETKIVESLETVENKKYEVGSSDLFQLNQRETSVLEVKKRQLEYYLNVLMIQQKIKKEMGEFISL